MATNNKMLNDFLLTHLCMHIITTHFKLWTPDYRPHRSRTFIVYYLYEFLLSFLYCVDYILSLGHLPPCLGAQGNVWP